MSSKEHQQGHPLKLGLRSSMVGATLVETALVLPLLVLLLFGIIQYGLILAAHIALTNASVAGARAATLDYGIQWSPQELYAQVVAVAQAAVAPLLDSNQTQVIFDPNYSTPNEVKNTKKVDLIYDFPLFFPFVVPSALPGRTIRLTATTIAK